MISDECLAVTPRRAKPTRNPVSIEERKVESKSNAGKRCKKNQSTNMVQVCRRRSPSSAINAKHQPLAASRSTCRCAECQNDVYRGIQAEQDDAVYMVLYLVSLRRKVMRSLRSLAFLRPPKAILVPGMYFFGFSRYSNCRSRQQQDPSR